MSFENYRTNPKDPLKQEKKRRKMAEKSQGTEPSGELYKLQEISQEKQIKEAQDFDKIMDSPMGVSFERNGKVYYNLEELQTDQELKKEFNISEFPDKEVKLSEQEFIDGRKFEEQTGWSLSELKGDEQKTDLSELEEEIADEEKRNLVKDWEELKAEDEQFGEPSPLEICFEENN